MNKSLQRVRNSIPAIVTLVAIILVWQGLCTFGIVPEYMLPSPIDVTKALVTDFPTIMMHSKVTLTEAIIGLGLGLALAFIVATLMDHVMTINRALYPLMIITQTIPTIAIAPILVLWLGFGMAPKIALVIITTFFPITVGLLDGYKSVDPDEINLMRSLGASSFQIFKYVKFPAAIPGFFSGLQISASYAVVGAVVAEWLGGFEGLGVYMTRVRKAYAFDNMFAVIIFIIIISLLLMFIVHVIRNVACPWIKVEQENQ